MIGATSFDYAASIDFCPDGEERTGQSSATQRIRAARLLSSSRLAPPSSFLSCPAPSFGYYSIIWSSWPGAGSFVWPPARAGQ
jgi:hypothetical protein